MSLLRAATEIRHNAYAPYSNFQVGAAIRTTSGAVFTGVNVENVAYPEGTCAEAGAIAAMIVAGETQIAEVAVIADAPQPVTPCGGCRQKLKEFSAPDVKVTMATVQGAALVMSMADLLPGAFSQDHLDM
jgi:cytidine deaminase